MGASSKTRRFRRQDEEFEGLGPLRAPVLPEAPAAPARPGVGAAAVSGMNGVVVNATVSFAAPAAEEALNRTMAARPRKDVIERIKSDSKTHGGVARPSADPERTAANAKLSEAAPASSRLVDRETLQEEGLPLGEPARSSPPTRAFSPLYARADGTPARRSSPALETVDEPAVSGDVDLFPVDGTAVAHAVPARGPLSVAPTRRDAIEPSPLRRAPELALGRPAVVDATLSFDPSVPPTPRTMAPTLEEEATEAPLRPEVARRSAPSVRPASLRASDVAPLEPAALASLDAPAQEALPTAPAEPGTSRVAIAVVFTLLLALLAGIIAMIAAGP